MTKIFNKYFNRETISYLICGVITTLVSLAVFWLARTFEQTIVVSNTLSTVIGILVAYILNKTVVFRAFSWAFLSLIREFFVFVVGRFGSFVMETLLLMLLVDFLGLPDFICKTFTMVLVVVVNYLISKKAVFRGS
ncbi:MAG: GtrA family protein [Turicibacter sp.]|nr:GtrA family protein [Turicibacter sp.]